MAITRAQQAKQMLRQGGRTGFFSGGIREGDDISPGTPSGGVGGGNTDRIRDVAERQRRQDLRDLATRQAEDKAFEQQGFERLRVRDTNFPGAIGTALNLLKGPRQKLLDTNIDYFRSLKSRGGAKNYATSAQGYKDYMTDRLAGKIDAAGNPIMDEDDDNNIILPFAQAPSNMDQEPSEDEKQLEGLRLAFRADGGRIGLQEGGGIEQRLEKLGGDVTSAEEMLQGINQRLQSAESSLGSGGGMQSPFTDQGSIVPQGGGIGGLPTTFAGGPKIPSISSVQTPDPFFGNTSLAALAQRPLPESMQSEPQNLEPLQAVDPYARTLLSGLSQDGQRFDSAQSAFDALAEQTRKAREINPFTRDMIGTELFQGAEGFKRFTDMFNEINDPNFVAPQLQLLSAQGNLGIPAAGYADGGNVVGGEFDFESARQMYGLGKLVKKVTRSVKKIAKSPIGKAALLYAGTAGLGALGAGAARAGTGFGIFAPSNVLSNLGATKALFTNKLFGDIVAPSMTRTGGLLSKIPGGGITAAIVGASALAGLLTPAQEEEAERLAAEEGIDIEAARNSILARAQGNIKGDLRATAFLAEGGKPEPVAKKTMPLLDMGGQEMDLRDNGGFVPIGRMEKADDVPARLSKNEFVFTADAVRNAGDGDVDKGAEVMYNMMKNLEAGGEVSEESQGLEGARKMFQTSQRLEEVL